MIVMLVQMQITTFSMLREQACTVTCGTTTAVYEPKCANIIMTFDTCMRLSDAATMPSLALRQHEMSAKHALHLPGMKCYCQADAQSSLRLIASKYLPRTDSLKMFPISHHHKKACREYPAMLFTDPAWLLIELCRSVYTGIVKVSDVSVSAMGAQVLVRMWKQSWCVSGLRPPTTLS